MNVHLFDTVFVGVVCEYGTVTLHVKITQHPNRPEEHTVADAKRNRVLANVVRVGRQELADREPADIPHKLRAVARSTGRGLPMPLQQTLLTFIETDEEFRASVEARFERSSVDDAIATAFLADPDEARALIDARLASDDAERLRSESEAARAATADLEGKLSVARERIEEMRVEHERKLDDQAAAAKRARQGLEARLSESVREVARLTSENDDLNDQVASLAATVAELRDRLARRDERTQRQIEASTRDGADGVNQSLPSDPVALAAMLDDLERQLHFYRESVTGSVEAETQDQPFRLPFGLSSESPEALAAVLDQRPDSIVVDGYNVAGAVSGASVGKRPGRNDAVARADALKRASPGSEVIVFFDASDVAGRDGYSTPDGVVVEFEPTTTADDAIVEFVHAGSDRCLVITNDRELQDRSAREGCIVVFSTALISWTEHLNGRAV